jgi:hypothetical protein
MRALLVVLGIVPAAFLAAQQASLTGPVEAYTYDGPTRSLRAVIGFPGAAQFGPPLRDSLDFASIAPRQSYGLGFQRGQCLLISGLGSALVSTRLVAGVSGQPEGIVWSGDGSRAVLFSRSANWIQVLSGFPNAPAAGLLVDASSLGGALVSVGADPQGKLIAAGISGESGAVYVSSDGQNFTSLASVAKPIALSFSTDGRTLYALDGASPQVFSIDVSSRAYQAIPLTGLAAPVAIQGVQDAENRQVLYVAGDHRLRILDVASQQTVTDVALGFEPTSLDQFGSNSYVVASRSRAANPLWLVTSVPQPAAYFVPAVQLRSADHRRVNAVRGAR